MLANVSNPITINCKCLVGGGNLSLDKLVKEAMETVRSFPKGTAGSLGMDRDLILIWGLYRGWSDAAIAKVLRVHPTTVKRHMEKLTEHPSLIFRCPVMRKGIRYKKTVWICEFCEEELEGSDREAREHVASHVCSIEQIQVEGVMPDDYQYFS